MRRNSPLMAAVRQKLRVNHYSIRTEKSYIYWIKFYIRFHGLRHPSKLSAPDIKKFLTYLAVTRNVAPSTQIEEVAILFLYQKVLEIELPLLENITRANKPSRLPTVFTKAEAKRIINRLPTNHVLPVELMYGSGLRVMECVRLRAKISILITHRLLSGQAKANKNG